MATATLQKSDPAKARQYFENKLAFTTGPVELEHDRHHGDIAIIDVRAGEDYAQGHIPGARSLPQAQWDSFEGLEKDKLNLLYCYSQVCHLAARAGAKFAAQGYSVMELEGGFAAWQEHDMPVEQ